MGLIEASGFRQRPRSTAKLLLKLIITASVLAIPDTHAEPDAPWTPSSVSISYASHRNYTALDCPRYEQTYKQIDDDLTIHRKLGGTQWNATRYIAKRLGTVGMRGLTVGFFGGRAYLLLPTDFRALHHHARLHVAYMRMLLHLEDTFGGPQHDPHQQQQQQGQQRPQQQQQGDGQDGTQQVQRSPVPEPSVDSSSSSSYSSHRRRRRRVKQEGGSEHDAAASGGPAGATKGGESNDGSGYPNDGNGLDSSGLDSGSSNSPGSDSRPSSNNGSSGSGSSSSSSIPDVVFILTTSDTPRYVSPLLYNTTHPPDRRDPLAPGGDFVPGPYPVAAIGKSDYWPDTLLVPNFHNHMKRYDSTTLALIPQFNAATAWEDRREVVFGKFSMYRTNRHAGDASTFKLGFRGKNICYNGNQTCPTREHFIKKVAAKYPDILQVGFTAKVPMMDHTKYKYLINLDGQGISSRLEQLLPLGSVVFKERSGYYAYYYRTLLQDRVNCVEFWKTGPEDILEQVQWAKEHDQEARRIAQAGQALAARYLTGAGRTCYWYRLLHGLAGSLAFRPTLVPWPRAVPVREVVQRQLLATEEGRKLWAEAWEP